MQKPERIEIIAVFHDEVNKCDEREVLRAFKSDDSEYEYWFDDLEGFFAYERDKDYFDERFEEMEKAGFTGASIGVKFVWEDLKDGLHKD